MMWLYIILAVLVIGGVSCFFMCKKGCCLGNGSSCCGRQDKTQSENKTEENKNQTTQQ
jgi:hypothetical protein